MKGNRIALVILIAYSALLIKVMIFKDVPTIRIGQLMLNFSGTDGNHPPNFIPFKTILQYLFGDKGFIIAGANIIGNIVLLVPAGFLLPLAFRTINGKKTMIIGLTAALVIEVMQVLLHVGTFDIDDILLNALGVMIGYWTFHILSEWVQKRNYRNIIITAILFTAAVAATVWYITPKKGQPVILPQDMNGPQPDSLSADNNERFNGKDPCGGTKGTGEIISIAGHTITVRLNDDQLQTYTLTVETMIRTAAGTATKGSLKTGDRVTLVVNEGDIATAVFVCGEK